MKKTKILIVEDEIVAAMDLKTQIEKMKCEVTAIVHTQKRALNSIAQNEPDIII